MINQTSQMQALQAFIEKKRQKSSSFEEEFTFADFQSFVKKRYPLAVIDLSDRYIESGNPDAKFF